MVLARIVSLLRAYSLYLYAAGFLALILSLNQIREARKLQQETIFSLERELASTKARRGTMSMLATLVYLALVTYVAYALLPSETKPPEIEPTPTLMVIELPTSTPITPTPTRTRIPTRPRATALPPTPTAAPTVPPAPLCPNPGVRITSPFVNQTVSGEVSIQGTARIDQFQFYKLEYGLGEKPQVWNSIGEVQRAAVTDSVLGVWNLAGFPRGAAWIRLTVVDLSGNFPPPCELRVVIQ